MDANSCSKYILEELKQNHIQKDTAISLIKQLHEKEDIAVIGIGMKYYDTEDYNDYWNLIYSKKTVIERCSKQRIDLIRNCFPRPLLANESMYCKGSFIKDLHMFDYDVFSLTKAEGEAMNPGHRIILQAAYRTLEDAGYLGERNEGNKTGVFIGNNFTKDFLFSYSLMSLHNSAYNFTFDYMLNNWSSGLATRISNVFNLKGPSYTIDASCPSSTVAIFNACKALHDKQCTTAIAGGLLVDMSPIKRYNNSGWIFLHEDNVITRSYDDNVGGAYIAEGAAALFLKPLSRAIEDGDRIHGIINGMAFNNNGSSGSYTQSSVEDIKKVVAAAVKDAGINVEDINYLEGEGYPHKLEEGLEVAGLIAGFGQFTNKKQFCGMGSISANVGYLQSAIGVFNSIKVLLAMKNKTIPPLYHFVSPTDMVNLCKSPFYVSDMPKSWERPANKERQAAVYSYGYGGTNMMLMFKEAPKREKNRKEERESVFVLTAKSEASFYAYVEQYINFLEEKGRGVDFMDLCFTAGARRMLYSEYRLAVIARDNEALLDKLKKFIRTAKTPEGVFFHRQTEEEKQRKKKGIAVSIEDETLAEVADSFVRGKNYKFSEMYKGSGATQTELPAYPFDKKYCWCRKEKRKRASGGNQ